MVDSPERLAERLQVEGAKTVDFFSTLTDKQWLEQVYSEGVSWQLRDILAHFVSAEIGHLLVIKDIVAGGSGAPADFNVDTFNNARVEQLKTASASALVEMFSTNRAATVEYVKSLNAQDLYKRGRHPFYADGSVEDMVKLIYRHIQVHLRDVKRILTPASETPGLGELT